MNLTQEQDFGFSPLGIDIKLNTIGIDHYDDGYPYATHTTVTVK